MLNTTAHQSVTIPFRRTIVACIVLAAATIIWVNPVGGTDSESRLKSVQFDLVDQASSDNLGGPLGAQDAAMAASYRTIIVSDAGADKTLNPVGGTVRLTVAQSRLAAMTAQQNGTQFGHATEGFAKLLADAISSASAHSFVRVGSYDGGQPVELNLFYDRPLGASDYLLIQEGGGDAAVTVTPIDGSGTAMGPGRQLGPDYQWNTGHGPASEPTGWASVMSVASLLESDQPVAGFRVTAANAQIKAMALTPTPAPASTPTPTPTPAPTAEPSQSPVAAQTAAPAPSSGLPPAPGLATVSPVEGADPATGGIEPEFASVGLETKIQPAIAVGGVGCIDGPATDPAALTVGQAVTFCFLVTNLGSTNLTSLAVTDELLGLADAKLPKAAGPDVLKPGEQAVFYYHSVLAARPANSMSSVTASVVDDGGAPVAGVVTPTAASNSATETSAVEGGGVVESQTAPLPQAPAASASAGQPVRASQSAPAASSVSEAAPLAVTQLAMTGVPTEPWVLVIFAMAFIFIGYTAYAAFQKRIANSEPAGHEQLDALGFE